MSAAYIFYGVRPYGYAVTCAESLEDAARAVGVPAERCREWLEPYTTKRPYGFRIVEPGDSVEIGE